MPDTKVAFTDAHAYVREYGNVVDRIGNDNGGYLAAVEHGKPASWEGRALHVNSLCDPYNAYRLDPDKVPTGWTIEASEVAPALGQPGGAIQVRILGSDGKSVPVHILNTLGILE
ncbi:TNT domain-containing protein [Mycobacterium sp. IS-3022]|uniref:TNT domain-containing protein n=1 Tax=Mycobacterium sp. IS-3022 TaxID=1772277 RepID=UPI000AB60436|nr:TNT domain-containing protein [Mycobacterium sp. IS-3022]